MTPVATLTSVSHRYRRTVALDDVTLQVPSGIVMGLIGPDGVGKSTLLALLAGAKQLQLGQVHVLGGDMAQAAHRDAVCARIAYMPQGLGKNLYPDLSVRENIDFFARLFGHGAAERAQRIDTLLHATGLTPFANRPAGKLSGGMRQKLGLCCALIHDPDLLILDEPTTGVDPLSRRQFWELIDRMRAERPTMTVLVATAYMEEAERFDQLAAMNGGRILAAGTPTSLLQQTGSATIEQAFTALTTGGRPPPPLVIPPRDASHTDLAIEAHGLTRRFGDFTAVDHVDFAIERGEIFAFVGSNGCGKTTTMKMLCGLLPTTEGEATLFGRAIDARDIDLRRRVGYMSQSFSLWAELTVQQNLALHARLFHLPAEYAAARIKQLIDRFGLTAYRDAEAGALPLGLRQRLSLAVAVVHEPDLLILDEPTSGVDPVARDEFWEVLGELSREQGVTIFVSTHFMNEAARCDRVSLMHAGLVLATGTPAELVASQHAASLEEAFIRYLEAVTPPEQLAPSRLPSAVRTQQAAKPTGGPWARITAYALRETLELWRDPVRLGFAVLGTVFLMLVLGFGLNTDVEHVAFAALDRDRTPESRAYLEELRGSIYFEEHRPLPGYAEMADRMASGELKVAVELPPGFGRDLRRGRPVEVGAWINGAMPFHAETARGYLEGVHTTFLRDLALETAAGIAPADADIETRFIYNQDFRSAEAMVPGVMALLLALIPAILMALAVVREKELGSITNLYVTPTRRIEFVVGKLLPYIGIAFLDFWFLAIMSITIFDVPLKGSVPTLALGALIYVSATTCYGLLISVFSSTQIAALFGTAILTFMPAMSFSGMLTPVSAMTGMGWVMGKLFPMTYFLPVAVGVFTKSLGLAALAPQLIFLALFVPGLLALSVNLLRKQEL
jgi:ribosome-dependent ATPase